MDSEALFLDRLADAATEVGQPGFYRELRDVLGVHLKADLSMIMRYSKRSAPEYLTDDGLSPEHMALYLRGLYRIDPIYRLCRDGVARGVLDLSEISTPSDRSGGYFNLFLCLTGMLDDLAILLPLSSESSLGLVYERKSRFRKHEIREMQQIFSLIESLHHLHQKFSGGSGVKSTTTTGEGNRKTPGLPPLDYGEALDSFLRDKLTPRERDILRLILIGYPNARTAQRLNVTVHTIKNHKKRMYRKLDITTERELFLNFITFLFQQS